MITAHENQTQTQANSREQWADTQSISTTWQHWREKHCCVDIINTSGYLHWGRQHIGSFCYIIQRQLTQLKSQKWHQWLPRDDQRTMRVDYKVIQNAWRITDLIHSPHLQKVPRHMSVLNWLKYTSEMVTSLRMSITLQETARGQWWAACPVHVEPWFNPHHHF